jgi:hypothetical protein
MDIMAKAEILTEKEFYEILSKDHGKLTTIEIEDIKNILRANKKLLGNEYGAYTFTDNGESYWVIEKYGKPEFKKRISDIWGEDWKKEDIKIDGMGLKEYAVSSAFKKRVLSTIASNGLDYLKEAWEVENNIKEEVTEIDVLNEIRSYAQNKLGIKLSSSEIVEYMFKNGNPNVISASETHYVKDKFCDCVNKNMENVNIALKGKQSRTDAVESFCYNTIVGSRIVASERKNMDMNKIVWEILGSEYCKCVEKNNEKVCSYLESEVIGYDKLSLSHKIFAKQFEIKSGFFDDEMWNGDLEDTDYEESKKYKFTDINDLKNEVKNNIWNSPDYITVGGTDYIMVEYSGGGIKNYKGKNGSRSKEIVYADENTLKKEIHIDYSNDDVYEDKAGVDWTYKGYQPKIKAGDKKYKEQDNIGEAKYSVSYHDGKSKHDDGSDFYGIKIFKNKKERDDFVYDLQRQGYIEGSNKIKIRSTTNMDVIDMFLNDSFPKDKMPKWGTNNLKINKSANGWGLLNYSTWVAFRDNNGNVYLNNQKYSQTTSVIQNGIKNKAKELNINLVDVDEEKINEIAG